MMKGRAHLELIWLLQPLDRCPFSGERIYAAEVDLTLTGENLVLVDWVLGRCEQSDRWYGMLADLIVVLDQEGVSLGTVDGFLIDDEEAAAGVWLDAAADVMPWHLVNEKMGQYTAMPTGPPPSTDEVRALPMLPDPWELGWCAAAWYVNDEGEETPSYVAIVLDPSAGIRGHTLQGETPPDTPQLARLVLEAAARPGAGAPGRPREVRIEDAGLADALADALAGAAIPVRAAPTPRADEALADMQHSLRGERDDPFFIAHDEQTVRAFFRAAKAFYRARPWDRIDGNKYVGFRLGDGPWGYLNVMGQAGEEFGLSYFEDWLQLCRLVHNQPTPYEAVMGVGEGKALAAAGALEGLTLEPAAALHPDDAAYLQRLAFRPLRQGLYPFVRRFTLEGLENPRLPLSAYQALMEALADALAKRRAATVTSIKQTLTVGEAPVALRYPARGTEPFEDQPPGSFRLIITEIDKASSPGLARIEVDTPGDARVDEVGYAIKKEAGDAFWMNRIFSGDHALWSGDFGRGAPCPRVAHLAGLPSLAIEFLASPYPMQVMPLMGAGVSDIKVTLVGR